MDTFQRFLGQQVIKVSVLGGCWSPDSWCKDWQARLHYISKCEGNVLEQLASGLSGRWFPVMENFQKSSSGSILLSQSGLLGLWFSMQENKEDSLWHSYSWLSIGPLWRHIQRSPISPFLTAYLSNVLSTWCVPAAMIIAHSSKLCHYTQGSWRPGPESRVCWWRPRQRHHWVCQSSPCPLSLRRLLCSTENPCFTWSLFICSDILSSLKEKER